MNNLFTGVYDPTTLENNTSDAKVAAESNKENIEHADHGLPSLKTFISNIWNAIGDATSGLSALRTRIDAAVTAATNAYNKSVQIYSKVDSEIASLQTTVNAMGGSLIYSGNTTGAVALPRIGVYFVATGAAGCGCIYICKKNSSSTFLSFMSSASDAGVTLSSGNKSIYTNAAITTVYQLV